MNTVFQWEIFLRDTGAGETYFHWLVAAWGWTLKVSFFSWIVAVVFGTFIGIIRTLPNKLIAFLGNSWTEIFRNIPLIIQVFIWYHVFPSIFLCLRQIPTFVLVIIALGFFTSARISELVKSGIESLPKGQLQACRALGLSTVQSYRYVLIPLAFRVILPPLTSESMSVVKNSSVAFVVSIPELTMFALQAGEETSRNIEIFFATTCLYFISALSVNFISSFIEKKLLHQGTHGAKK